MKFPDDIPKQGKKYSKKHNRSHCPIAEFGEDGFAKGWVFMVPRAHEKSLDIKKTDVVKNKVKSKIRTQGMVYKFETGDTFHNSPLAYTNWEEYLKHDAMTIQIKICESSSGYEYDPDVKDGILTKKYSYRHGSATIVVMTPNDDHTSMIERETNITLIELIDILKNGDKHGLIGK